MTTANDVLGTARAVYAAFERGDMPGFFALMAPDMVWNEAAGHPYGGRHVGADAIVQNVMMPLGTQWEDFSASTDRFVADGDIVLTVNGRPAGSFAPEGTMAGGSRDCLVPVRRSLGQRWEPSPAASKQGLASRGTAGAGQPARAALPVRGPRCTRCEDRGARRAEAVQPAP